MSISIGKTSVNDSVIERPLLERINAETIDIGISTKNYRIILREEYLYLINEWK
ncbi:hypothetical protein [Nitrosomonas communis]|uniref:hypothetical protein n=1 Tax=Nitrosomonas communis TaxID=44574 RepID=UPI0026E9CE4B|nr:hypothetical protein [Nitrosomonas communis]